MANSWPKIFRHRYALLQINNNNLTCPSNRWLLGGRLYISPNIHYVIRCWRSRINLLSINCQYTFIGYQAICRYPWKELINRNTTRTYNNRNCAFLNITYWFSAEKINKILKSIKDKVIVRTFLRFLLCQILHLFEILCKSII